MRKKKPSRKSKIELLNWGRFLNFAMKMTGKKNQNFTTYLECIDILMSDEKFYFLF